MPVIDNLTVFLLASIAVLIMPGPAIFYIVSRSVQYGSRVGLVSTLGINTGTLVHIAAAAFGASAILLTSATAFAVFKYAGAVALIWLGVRKLRERNTMPAPLRFSRSTLREVFLEGVVVNALNPKTALFFYAFLPQFVNIAHGNVAGQVLFLGLLFVTLGIINDGLYALAAGTLAGKLERNERLARLQRRVTGGTLIVLGVLAAFARPAQK